MSVFKYAILSVDFSLTRCDEGNAEEKWAQQTLSNYLVTDDKSQQLAMSVYCSCHWFFSLLVLSVMTGRASVIL